jgi:poly(hydroxyalkanoate) granule-associated protein
MRSRHFAVPTSEHSMAKPKLKARSKTEQASHEARSVGKTVMDSAQQIWLAGLGAFAKAQEEGGKLFESLVKDGAALDAKTRKFTEAKVGEARSGVESTLGQVRERSQETWDKLEKVFEDRVSRSLGRLGIPGKDELAALHKRVDDLARELHKRGDSAATTAKRTAASKSPAKKAARKAVRKAG